MQWKKESRHNSLANSLAQRRKFEQQAAKILSEEWNTIGKDLSVGLLGSVDVVRGWWMGDFNPGLQVFIDKADEKQTDAAAATLACA